MKKRGIWIFGGIVVLAGLIFFFTRGTQGGKEVIYRYEAARTGELLLSTTSVGTMVPLTQVDVKSKAGGRVDKLLVQEGSIVNTGDVIAMIDPTDTKTIYDQAAADLDSAKARVEQASTNATLEERNAVTRVKDAEVALKLAQVRLDRAVTDARTQPSLTKAEIDRSNAEIRAQREALRAYDEVQTPQMRRDARSSVFSAETSLKTAQNELDRQKALLGKGYVSQASVERAESACASAQATLDTARQKLQTLEADIRSSRSSLQARLTQSETAAQVALVNRSKDVQADRSVTEARRALEQARLDLRSAIDSRLTVKARQIDVSTAKSSVIRNRVAAENALDNLNQTTVKAPRPGVVTLKYLEEGTIIPGAVSAFAQGTSIVQISDVTTMFVECKVDESDIASIKIGQQARVILEAYPGSFFKGDVQRIFPAAETENGAVTSIKVRVKLDSSGLKHKDKPVKPGMNATVEFIHLLKPKVLIIPSQAVHKGENGGSFVKVKSPEGQPPVERAVKIGDTGNDGVEVLEGLKDGDEVVVAEIDLASARERQEKMLKQEQGGGLGSSTSRGPSQSRRGGAGGGR